MGACFLELVFDGSLSQDEVRKKFEAQREEDAYETGHDGYAGNWHTIHGIVFRTTVYSSREDAVEYLKEHCEKWSHAIAVLFEDTRRKLSKVPTFDGKEPSRQPSYDGKYHCYLDIWENGRRTITPADQLTDLQKTRLRQLWGTAQDASTVARCAKDDFQEHLQKLGDPAMWAQKWWEPAELKRLRTRHFKTQAARKKAQAALDEFNERMVKKLYKETCESQATKWLVGGLAAM